MSQEGFHFAAEAGVALTSCVELGDALRRMQLDHRVEDFLNAPPARGVELTVRGLAHRLRILLQQDQPGSGGAGRGRRC